MRRQPLALPPNLPSENFVCFIRPPFVSRLAQHIFSPLSGPVFWENVTSALPLDPFDQSCMLADEAGVPFEPSPGCRSDQLSISPFGGPDRSCESGGFPNLKPTKTQDQAAQALAADSPTNRFFNNLLRKRRKRLYGAKSSFWGRVLGYLLLVSRTSP